MLPVMIISYDNSIVEYLHYYRYKYSVIFKFARNSVKYTDVNPPRVHTSVFSGD